MPVEASPTASVFSYPSSWQSNGNYWNATSVPGPMPMNVCSGRNICKYSMEGRRKCFCLYLCKNTRKANQRYNTFANKLRDL